MEQIKNIKVQNFKSFEDIDVTLNSLNILIGANASGKSNFIEIFKFLRDITSLGLDNAISLQGGVEYLKNINLTSDKDFFLEITYKNHFSFGKKIKNKLYGISFIESTYSFSLTFTEENYKIKTDELIQKIQVFHLEENEHKIEVKEKIGEGIVKYSNESGTLKVSLNFPENIPLSKEDFIHPFLINEDDDKKILKDSLIIQVIDLFLPRPERAFAEISIYDIDPKLPKNANLITGKSELEENGSNLSIVLKRILENPQRKTKFFNLIQELLPFVDGLDVEKFADKSLLFKLKETYSNHHLPGSLVSDGTINITALIVALFFEKNKSLIILEEPERNLHPYLISKIVELLKDASTKKQIIVTTHNPEMLKFSNIENIYLISRCEKGFSKITIPCENKQIQTFLKNEISLEDLYIQNLLG